MKQTRLESFLEACANTASGFVVSYVFWIVVVVPLFKMTVSPADNFIITSMFTGLSVARSYVWRRFFNAGVHRTIHKMMTKSEPWIK